MIPTPATAWDQPEDDALEDAEASPSETVSRPTLRTFLAIAFVLGVLDQFTVRLVGLMPVDEIILATVLIWAGAAAIFTRKWPVTLPAPRLCALLAVAQAIGFLGYVVSDLYRESYPSDIARGWMRMVFLIINIIAFAVIFGVSPRCFIWHQAGLAFSFVEALIHGPLFGDYWKFGFAFPLTVLVLLAAPRWLGYWGSLAACLGLGVLHAVMDFRSLAGVCVLMAALLSFHLLPPLARKMLFALSAAAATALLPWSAQHALSDAGERATRSNVERSAMLQAAWEGFLKSPLIGQGSWFSKSTVMDEFLLLRSQNARLSGVGGMSDTDAENVAIHSQILVALAEGGIFGAAFFFAYAVVLGWGLWYLTAAAPWDWSIPAKLFVLLIALWNLFMSPFSGTHRVEIALACGVAFLLWQQRTDQKMAVHEGSPN